MVRTTGISLFRLISAVLFSVLIAFSSMPDSSRVHAENPENPYAGHGSDVDADHHSEAAASFEQCHPGLECLSIAAFLLTPASPAPSDVRKSRVWPHGLADKSWTPASDNPPPRSQS